MTDRVRPSLADTLTAWLAAAALGLCGFALVGCGADDAATAEPPAASVEAAEAGDVDFEPAYPDEVSPEGLTAEDVRQQETPHSHGGETHVHDDGEAHAHDDEGEDHHDHDDGVHAH